MKKRNAVIILIAFLIALGLFPHVGFAEGEGQCCTITTYAENGRIDSTRQVKTGANAVIRTKPEGGYFLKAVYVDGRETELIHEEANDIDVLMNTADAFYSRGEEVQYDNGLRENYITPYQEGTLYTDCSGFTFASYYNAFGIEIPTSTKLLDAYAKAHVGTAYVVEYMDQATYQANVENIFDMIIGKLQKGDLVTIRTDTDKGHTMMVYDFLENKKGVVTDAVIIHATGNNEEFESRQCFYDKNVTEGAIRKYSLKRRLKNMYSGENIVSFSVIRPLAVPGVFLNDKGQQEKYSSMRANAYYIFENVCENHEIIVEYQEKRFFIMRAVKARWYETRYLR